MYQPLVVRNAVRAVTHGATEVSFCRVLQETDEGVCGCVERISRTLPHRVCAQLSGSNFPVEAVAAQQFGRGTPEILPFLHGLLKLEQRDIYQGTRLRPDFPVVPFPLDRASLLKLPCGAQIRSEWEAIAKACVPAGERNLRDYLETSVGPTLTELAFEGFNRKFWGRSLEEMPAEWGKLRRLEHDDGYHILHVASADAVSRSVSRCRPGGAVRHTVQDSRRPAGVTVCLQRVLGQSPGSGSR